MQNIKKFHGGLEREKRKVTSRSTYYPTINLIKVYEIWAYILLCKQYSSKTFTHHIQSSDYYTFSKQLHKYQLISFLKLKIIANTDNQFLCTILCGSPESSTLFQASRPPTLWCGVLTTPALKAQKLPHNHNFILFYQIIWIKKFFLRQKFFFKIFKKSIQMNCAGGVRVVCGCGQHHI